jgi:hypothetical protein
MYVYEDGVVEVVDIYKGLITFRSTRGSDA